MISLFCLQKNRRKGRKAQKENRKPTKTDGKGRPNALKVKVSLFFGVFGGASAVPVVLVVVFGCFVCGFPFVLPFVACVYVKV